MAERQIKAGVTLMQDFCRPGSDAYKGYIDYITREEAQRNNAFATFFAPLYGVNVVTL